VKGDSYRNTLRRLE